MIREPGERCYLKVRFLQLVSGASALYSYAIFSVLPLQACF
jgi:hypothetical protein